MLVHGLVAVITDRVVCAHLTVHSLVERPRFQVRQCAPGHVLAFDCVIVHGKTTLVAQQRVQFMRVHGPVLAGLHDDVTSGAIAHVIVTLSVRCCCVVAESLRVQGRRLIVAVTLQLGRVHSKFVVCRSEIVSRSHCH